MIKYNGLFQTNSKMVQVVAETVKGGNTPKELIDLQVKWLKDNCENLDDINVFKVVESVWYDIKGIYNSRIRTCIEEAIVSNGIEEY